MRDLFAVTVAELGKMRRRPGAWVLLGAGLLLSLTFGYFIPYLSYASDSGGGGFTAGTTPEEMLTGTLPGQLVTRAISALPIFSGALVLVLGALVTGGEYAAGTLKTLLTQGPRRGIVFGGQVLACVLAAAVGVVALFVGCATAATAIALVEDRALDWPAVPDLLLGVATGWAVAAMWATLGAALGVLLRSVALPIGLGVVWILGVENLLDAVASTTLTALEPVRDLLPGVNSGSLILSVLPPGPGELPPGVADTVSGIHGLVVVLAYAGVAAAALLVAGRRRDVA